MMKKRKRSHAAVWVVILSVILVLGACSANQATSPANDESAGNSPNTTSNSSSVSLAGENQSGENEAGGEPVKIGVINAMTGPLATPGIFANNGFQLYFEEVGNTVAGRPIELIFEDTKGDPAQGIERAKRLVERENVHILAGITSSAVAYAVRDYVDQTGVPLLIMGSSGANGLTDEQSSPYIFRTSFTNRQFNTPFGAYMYDTLGYKKVAVMASDFVTGYEQSEAFEEGFTAKGGEVIQKIFVPMGTTDYAPFISQLKTGEIDSVWAMFFGADSVSFIKQYGEFGLKGKIPLTGSAGLADENNLGGMGDTAEGIVMPVFYSPELDNAESRKFVESFQAKYGSAPGATSSSGYVAAEAIARAIEAVNGNVEDTDAFAAALRQVEFASVQGLFEFDDKQNVVFDLYAARVEKVDDGAYRPVIVEPMFERVDQFWKP